MYETASLPDATFLRIKGCQLSRIIPNGGSFLLFEFADLDEQGALSLLNSRDAELVRGFHRALRDLRRQMDAITAKGAGR